MAKPKKSDDTPKKRRRPPAKSPEGRENQLISLAVDLAEKQLAEGTASPSVITHYLKLGTTREVLEKEKLRREVEVLEKKAEAFESAKHTEELYSQALEAMKSYRMSTDGEDEG